MRKKMKITVQLINTITVKRTFIFETFRTSAT